MAYNWVWWVGVPQEWILLNLKKKKYSCNIRSKLGAGEEWGSVANVIKCPQSMQGPGKGCLSSGQSTRQMSLQMSVPKRLSTHMTGVWHRASEQGAGTEPGFLTPKSTSSPSNRSFLPSLSLRIVPRQSLSWSFASGCWENWRTPPLLREKISVELWAKVGSP